jgi:predicted CoA-binding protein
VTARDDPATIASVLERARTVAIVGLSPNKLRASHFVGYYLQRHGYRVLPVNPMHETILGERCYASLLEVPVHVDVVDVFRDAAAVPAIADDAVAIGAGALWLQYGVVSEAGADTAERGGLAVVMDRCMKVEHARLFGRMHWLGFNTGRVSASRSHG